MKKPSSAIFLWILRIIASLIMLQTLYYKFSGSAESVYIFSQMNMEPWGRYATGIAELVASLLILYKPTTPFGAFFAAGIMSGALLSHVFVLGIEVMGDHGLLFLYALIVWVAAILLLWIEKEKLFNSIKKLTSRRT
ncbi:DoxX family membrane protein [Sediminibacterium goheungense]|uniref:DoxX-like protein n=1 Tax=Sediminibacterium goheungense TaxID=1086393 RepID=A0A4R6J1A4_9BACT|nr:DoxX family membrane protein [Sediminibacterium goheungense]TDO29022.1 DoxX-like protein [Sediminibacterium goheungense]